MPGRQRQFVALAPENVGRAREGLSAAGPELGPRGPAEPGSSRCQLRHAPWRPHVRTPSCTNPVFTHRPGEPTARDWNAEIARVRAYATGWLADDERERVGTFLALVESASRGRRLLPGERTPQQEDVVRRLQADGAVGLLNAPGGRGDDFGANQGMGAWAETLVERTLTCRGSRWAAVRLGPSDGVLPGDDDYERRRRRYRELEVFEGKRPDILLYEHDRVPPGAHEWVARPLSDADVAGVRIARAAIEIKSSAAEAEAYRARTRRSLSFTVKEEEGPGIARWLERFSVPLLLVQVLLSDVSVIPYVCFDAAKGEPRLSPVGKPTWFVPCAPGWRVAHIEGGPAYQQLLADAHGGGGLLKMRPSLWPPADLVPVGRQRATVRGDGGRLASNDPSWFGDALIAQLDREERC